MHHCTVNPHCFQLLVVEHFAVMDKSCKQLLLTETRDTPSSDSFCLFSSYIALSKFVVFSRCLSYKQTADQTALVFNCVLKLLLLMICFEVQRFKAIRILIRCVTVFQVVSFLLLSFL